MCPYCVDRYLVLVLCRSPLRLHFQAGAILESFLVMKYARHAQYWYSLLCFSPDLHQVMHLGDRSLISNDSILQHQVPRQSASQPTTQPIDHPKNQSIPIWSLPPQPPGNRRDGRDGSPCHHGCHQSGGGGHDVVAGLRTEFIVWTVSIHRPWPTRKWTLN